MKTVVLLERSFLGGVVHQNSSTGYFSATDLFKEGNSWRISNKMQPIDMTIWLRQKNVKEFIECLENEIGKAAKISGRGRGVHTWVHPYLFIDMALSINPKLKLTVYEWIYDELVKYRNNSGDSYKKMAGALYINISNKANFKDTIIEVANRIKLECHVDRWETATENQLKLRDKMHEYISMLSDIIRDKENLLDVAIKKAKVEMVENA